MTRTTGFLLLACAVQTTTACQWKDKQTIVSAVWSDDDAEQAYIRSRWEERKVFMVIETATERRNFEYQVVIQRPNGSERHALIPWRDGHPSPELYYVRSHDYVIYGAVESGSTMTLRQLSADGTQRTIAESGAAYSPCGAFSAVPSPDGSRLALFERQLVSGAYAPPGDPPPDAVAECQHLSIVVAFVDADTLSQQGRWSWEADGVTEYGWMSDGEFYVQAQGASWRIDASTGPQPVSAPTCLTPKTTTSDVSSTGLFISPTSDPNDPIRVRPEVSTSPFGACSGG